jgi:hypothetical protein
MHQYVTCAVLFQSSHFLVSPLPSWNLTFWSKFTLLINLLSSQSIPISFMICINFPSLQSQIHCATVWSKHTSCISKLICKYILNFLFNPSSKYHFFCLQNFLILQGLHSTSHVSDSMVTLAWSSISCACVDITEEKQGGWGLMDMEAKCQAILFIWLWQQGQREGSVVRAW